MNDGSLIMSKEDFIEELFDEGLISLEEITSLVQKQKIPMKILNLKFLKI